MLTWMTYAAVVAGFLAVGGLALERICDAAGWPRRFAWLAALTLTVFVPLSATPPNPADRVETRATADVTGASETVPVAATSPRSKDARESNPARVDRSAFLVWSIASLLAFTILCAVLIASARARRRWERRRVGSDQVYVSHGFGPALVGLLRPAVVVPRWILGLDPADQAAIVKHEREHARARDHLALLFCGLVAAAFPWSPAVWWMCARLRRAVEIDCDRRVIASGVPAAEYGSLLLGIGAGRPGRSLFALALADSGSLLERRLKAMSKERETVRLPGTIVLCAVAMATALAACELSPPTAIAPAVEEVLGARADVSDREASGTGRPGETSLGWRSFVTQDGRIRIRGANRTPSLSLDTTLVAANPLVLLDGRVVQGGVGSLLTIVDTLDFEYVEAVGIPAIAVAQYGYGAVGGAVIIGTKGSRWRSLVGRFLPPVRFTRQSEEPASRKEAAVRQVVAAREEVAAARDTDAARAETFREDDARVLVKGINEDSPSLSLDAATAARNPLALLDGKVIQGGLSSLLTMVDTLEFELVGLYGTPSRVVIRTKQEVD